MNECEVTICENCEEDEKETTVKKSNRKTSDMWNFFTPLTNEYALCNLCNQRFSYKTSTSNLKKHIVSRHSGAHLMGNSSKFSDENKSPPSSQQSKDIQAASPQRASRKKETLKQIVAETLKRPLFTEMNQGLERNGSWSLDRRRETDEYDAYGITVAAKLRRMNESQRLYCEKIINEALFKAALEQLTPLSEIVICIPTTHDT